MKLIIFSILCSALLSCAGGGLLPDLPEIKSEPGKTLAFSVDPTEVTVCNEVCLSGWTECEKGSSVSFDGDVYLCPSNAPLCFDGHEILCLDIYQKKEYQLTESEWQGVKHNFKHFAIDQIIHLIENEEYTLRKYPEYFTSKHRESLDYMKEFLRVKE